MAYNKFTLKGVLQKFQLSMTEKKGLFADAPPVPPSQILQTLLSEYEVVATATNTEKARSELLISPILMDIRRHLNNQISLFSGIKFDVDKARGLNGYCDYIIAQSPSHQFVTAPIIAIAEAKNDNAQDGFGQCIAEMVGARIFNEQEGTPQKMIFGASTTGTVWRFLQLQGDAVTLDLSDYHLSDLDKIIGILVQAINAGK